MSLTFCRFGEYPAPAKINLFLHVVGRRADGYHLLQTVFRLLDFGDRIRLAPRIDGVVQLATPLPGVPPEQDLTVRAARLIQEGCHSHAGVTIGIEKHIPAGGGLGGGSSDAATVLMGLNDLWRRHLSKDELKALGLRLGADVPVFIHGRSTFAQGIGERFHDVELPPAVYLITVPAVSVSTAEIFSAPELERNAPPIDPREWRPGFGCNMLEPVVTARYPEVARHLALLRELSPLARMSGSGACCFAEFASQEEAETAQARLPPDVRSFVARALDHHPLRCR